MASILAYFIIVLHLNNGSAKRISNFAGPYRETLGRGTNQTDEFKSSGKIWFSLRTTHPRIHSSQYAWGFEENVIEINDSLSVEVRISKWTNNQWKRNAFTMKFPHACTDTFSHAPALMHLYFGEEKCPIKPGSRIVKNQTIEITFPNVPVFLYGRWLFTLAIIMAKEAVGVQVTEFEVLPKI